MSTSNTFYFVILAIVLLGPQSAYGRPLEKKNPAITDSTKSKAQNKAPLSDRVSKPASSSSLAVGKRLYQTHCASCHQDGGNAIVLNKPVIGSQVLATGATFKSYLNQPLGTMPHYENLITDDELLNKLYAYVRVMDSNSADKQKKSVTSTNKQLPSKTKRESPSVPKDTR